MARGGGARPSSLFQTLKRAYWSYSKQNKTKPPKPHVVITTVIIFHMKITESWPTLDMAPAPADLEFGPRQGLSNGADLAAMQGLEEG